MLKSAIVGDFELSICGVALLHFNLLLLCGGEIGFMTGKSHRRSICLYYIICHCHQFCSINAQNSFRQTGFTNRRK